MSRLDLVIFGATGFTGKYAVEEMIRLAKKYPGLSWGVAGRSQKKLDSLMLKVAKKTDENLSSVKVILADVNDEQSLKAMCGLTKVVVNCCGPYRLYGEPVVRAAIDCNAHYVDVSGEPQFMEAMQLQYGERARAARVYVVSACGYDSIPNDMAVLFMQQNFGGTLNSVESYVKNFLPPELQSEAIKTGTIHYGTWESLVYSLAYNYEVKPLRQKLYPERLPTFKPKLQKRPVIHKRDNGWYVPFLSSDESVVYRTQRHLYERDNQRPVQFKAYLTFSNLFFTIFATLASVFLYFMTKTQFTRKLLLDYPRLFSLGMVSREGPSEAVMNGIKFSFVLYGEGWSEGLDVNSNKPDKRLVVKVSGTNPGYGATVTALILCALTVLHERDSMPGTGGVLTTGVAFKDTQLLNKLNENNVKFEIIDDSTK